jgi:hypothetical protein
MKSKISVIVGSVLALAITATEPVHAKGCDCTRQDLGVDKPVQLPPQPQPQTPIDSAQSKSRGDRVAGGHR